MDFEALREATTGFVRANQAWAPLIVGVLAFCESLAVLSLLVPATVMLVAVGALIGGAGLPFWPSVLGGAVGAALGDWLSYEVGRHLEHRAKGMWPLSRYPEMVAAGEAFCQRWGAWGVVLGRFFGPARAVVPLIAGVFRVPRLPFQAANVGSALAWSFALLAPGAGLLAWLRG